MKPKLTEIEKLKYWIDTEFSILHIMFAIVMFQLTGGWVWNIVLTAYIIITLMYMLVRVAYIAANDPNYLRVPRRDVE